MIIIIDGIFWHFDHVFGLVAILIMRLIHTWKKSTTALHELKQMSKTNINWYDWNIVH